MARIVWYPASGDWCEDLASTEGYWTHGVGLETLSQDLIVKAYGEASIKVEGPYNYYLDAIWIFNDGYEFNGTLFNSKLYFLHALDAHFSGICHVELQDNNGKSAWKDFGTNPSGDSLQFWEHSISLNPSDWTDFGIDWSQIRQVRILCDQKYAESGSFWIDKFHFEYEETPTALTINSKTLDNKTVTKLAFITSPLGYRDEITLPYSKGLSPNGTWTIEIISTDFVQWENGDVYKQRSLLLQGSPVAVTAYFISGTPPPPEKNYLWAIGAASIILIGSFAYYMMRKKR